MLSNISKAKLDELTRKMRAAASLPKEFFPKKGKAPLRLLKFNPTKTSRLPQGLSSKGKDQQPLHLLNILIWMDEPPTKRSSQFRSARLRARGEKAFGTSISTSQLMMSHSF